MRHKLPVLSLAAALVFGGCMKHTYVVGSGAPTDGEPTRSNKWNAHWAFGIVGEPTTNLAEVCPSGNATIKEKISFVNGLIGALVGVVYKPTTVEVWCEGGSAELELSVEQLRIAAHRPEAMELARSESRELAIRLAQARKRDRNRN
ncbi:MAG: hypothetical protein B7733_08085 [Myxococcales bacterium FL481]|nr:MAG: hypothetical protein B7733_08085 [Myxococcales bacterium FL481]